MACERTPFGWSCTRGSARRMCGACGKKPAVVACGFPLRGHREGHVCGAEVCDSCVGRDGNTPLCAAHARVIAARAAKEG